MRAWLVDTGPLVAYLDRSDPAHGRVAEVWDAFSGQLASTSAVMTECMHFLARGDDGPGLLAGLAAASRMNVYDYTHPAALRAAADLMKKYRSVPMDFADATLVLLAEDLGVTDVLTLDRRGFTVYRTSKRRPFRLFP